MFDPAESVSSSDSVESLKGRTRARKRQERRRKRHQSQTLSEDSLTIVTDYVSEDLFLMENKRDRLDINLLSNSLTARLRQSIPPDCKIQPAALNKLRRESLKDLVHLNNLNKQYTSQMNSESNRLDSEGFQLIRRQRQMKKHTMYQRKSQEKIEAQLIQQRSSGRSSAGSTLPLLSDSRTDSVFPSPREEGATTIDSQYPEFASVDKEDTSRVKVFKLRGIFQPQNKYPSRSSLEIVSPVKHPIGSHSEGTVPVDSRETPTDLPSKSKSRKGLRVTWSSQSQYFTEGSSQYRDPESDTEGREDSNPTPSSTTPSRPSRTNSGQLKKPVFTSGKSKIETIGLQWKLPPGSRPEKPARPSFPGVSRNLMPVTTAMDKQGTSSNKTRWHVQRVQSLSTYHMYKAWLEKLEILKGGASGMEGTRSTAGVPAIHAQSRMSPATAQTVK